MIYRESLFFCLIQIFLLLLLLYRTFLSLKLSKKKKKKTSLNLFIAITICHTTRTINIFASIVNAIHITKGKIY